MTLKIIKSKSLQKRPREDSVADLRYVEFEEGEENK